MKKLIALWSSLNSKFQSWNRKRLEKSKIASIAKTMDSEDTLASNNENASEYGIHPSRLSDFAIERGGHIMQTSLYTKKDGTVIKYPSKIKRNDNSIETISVLTIKEANELEIAERKTKEAAIGFPPRCPECETVLPEGTILGSNRPKEYVCFAPYIPLHAKPTILDLNPPATSKKIKVVRKKKSNRKK